MIFKITKQAGGFLKTAMNISKRAMIGGGVIMEKIGRSDRLAICATCDFHDKAKDKCNLCGCNLSVKISFLAAECPAKKW